MSREERRRNGWCYWACWFAYYGWVGSSSPVCVRCGRPNPNYRPEDDVFAEPTP